MHTKLLAPTRRSVGFNLHRAIFHRRIVLRIVPRTAPRPILRTRDEPALYRIATQIVQLLRQFLLTPNVEVEAFSGRPSPLPKSRAKSRDLGCQNGLVPCPCSLRETICLSICKATARLPRSGSLSSRCTCSGIKTNLVR